MIRKPCFYFEVTQSNGIKVKVQGWWELACTELLDRVGIKWESAHRKEHHLEAEGYRYIPDLYLPDYKVYFDPKQEDAIGTKYDAIRGRYKNVYFFCGESYLFQLQEWLSDRGIFITKETTQAIYDSCRTRNDQRYVDYCKSKAS